MMTMKGNQNRKLCMSNSLRRHAVPRDFKTNSDHIAFGTKTVDELRNSQKILDDFADDSKSGIRNTRVKANLNGFLFHLSDCKRIGVLSTSDETYRNENEYRDSNVPCVNADDNVSGYELPELIVCYKEIDCHVKDICIDEIRYTEDKMMMESGKSASEIGFGKDTSKECFPSDLMQIGEANSGATGKADNDVSEEGCFVGSTLPMQEFGTWSYLRSFLKSLNSEGHDVPKLPDQIPSGNAISDSPTALLVETEPNKGVQCNSTKRRSIENGAQSFNEQALEGVIPYLGPTAYSRSLSVQSDSSTTSTQSFTFPILQSEWNSSPVRMAKADRGHFRKDRSWKTGLLCCRF